MKRFLLGKIASLSSVCLSLVAFMFVFSYKGVIGSPNTPNELLEK